MAGSKVTANYLTLEKIHKLLDPGRVFYKVVVVDTIDRGDLAELKALRAGIRDAQAHYKDFDTLSKSVDAAIKKASK